MTLAESADIPNTDRERYNARAALVVIGLGVIACIFALAAGYRWFGGRYDYYVYRDFYGTVTSHTALFGGRYEPAFVGLIKLAKFYLNAEFEFFFSLIAGVALILKFRLLTKYSAAPIFAALIYLLMLYPLHEYTQIRAALGLALAYTAIDTFLEGRRAPSAVIAAAACLIHFSSIALLAGAFFAYIVAGWRPIIGIGTVLLAGLFGSVLISILTDYLTQLSPIIVTYLKNPNLFQAPRLLTGQNILLASVILSSAVFLRPWQDKRQHVFFLLSILSFVALVSLKAIPVFAGRISQLFLLPFFFYTFQFDSLHRSRIPAALLLASALWMLYKTFEQHLFVV